MTGALGGSGGSTVVIGWGLGVALLVLTAVATAVTGFAGLGIARRVATAAARAVLQLAVVSVVIVAVVRSLWLSLGFVLVMLTVAAVTSARRMTPHRSGLLAGVPIVAGAAPVIGIVVLTRAVPTTGIALVPVCGIVIGGAMTATSLAGRRALDELATRHGEYEAALSLGLTERDAATELVRPARRARHWCRRPDQTRTVGLVTLPGAFVGVLIGSGSPVQAGAAQVLVLIGLLAAEAVAAVMTTELVARMADHPAGPGTGAAAGVTTMLAAFAETMRPMASQSIGAGVSPRTTVPIPPATTGLTLMKMPKEWAWSSAASAAHCRFRSGSSGGAPTRIPRRRTWSVSSPSCTAGHVALRTVRGGDCSRIARRRVGASAASRVAAASVPSYRGCRSRPAPPYALDPGVSPGTTVETGLSCVHRRRRPIP